MITPLNQSLPALPLRHRFRPRRSATHRARSFSPSMRSSSSNVLSPRSAVPIPAIVRLRYGWLICLAVSASSARRIVLLIVLFAVNLTAGLALSTGTCNYDVRFEMTYRTDRRAPKFGFRCPGETWGGLDASRRAHARACRFSKKLTCRKDVFTSLAVSASLYRA